MSREKQTISISTYITQSPKPCQTLCKFWLCQQQPTPLYVYNIWEAPSVWHVHRLRWIGDNQNLLCGELLSATHQCLHFPAAFQGCLCALGTRSDHTFHSAWILTESIHPKHHRLRPKDLKSFERRETWLDGLLCTQTWSRSLAMWLTILLRKT